MISLDKIKKEYLGRTIVTIFGLFIIVLTMAIAGFLIYKGSLSFIVHGHSIFEFLFGSDYKPQDVGSGGTIGASIFIAGSILISTLAILIAAPFSIATAIFMTEISPNLGKKLLQPAIEIFVGIPSVVYGWVGLTVLVPFIARVFNLPYGFSVLAGAIVLAVMIFPTITSVCADAIRNIPAEYRALSFALGSTRWQFIQKVVIPTALPGILTGVVFGLARAFGEALAVAMVIGKMPRLADNLLSPTMNLTAQITADMGNTASGSEWNDSLWTMALLLLIISFIFIIIIRVLGRMGAQNR